MYHTTRNSKTVYSTFEVFTGIFPHDCGKIVPTRVPVLTKEELVNLEFFDFIETAAFTLKKFFPDLSKTECEYLCKIAFEKKADFGKMNEIDSMNFFGDEISSVVYLSEDEAVLEMNKGVTSNFSDYAAKLLVAYIARNRSLFKEKHIEIVTDEPDFFCSVCETVKNVSDVETVFVDKNIKRGYYEKAKISLAVKRGGIILHGYKNAEDYIEKSDKRNTSFVYLGTDSFLNVVTNYTFLLSSYADMVAGGMATDEGKINVALPFFSNGLLCAAIYLKQTTGGIDKIIVCDDETRSTANFFKKGELGRNAHTRDFERIYFELTGRNAEKTKEVFSLLENGETIYENGIIFLTKDYFVSAFDDDATLDAIAEFFEEFGYVFDYSSATGVAAANDYFDLTGDETPILYIALGTPLFTPEEAYLAIDELDVKTPYNAQKRLIEETGETLTDYVRAVSDEAKNSSASLKITSP